MKGWEQRLTGWGAFILTGLTLVAFLHLERDRFQHPLAAPVGVAWTKQHVSGGVNTVPVQYSDLITLTNASGTDLENVEVVLANWATSTEVRCRVGRLAAGQGRQISLIDLRNGFPVGYEIGPRDVLIVHCPGYADKRIPVKELGKDRLLREMEKEEDKESNADPEFWVRFWEWQDGLRKRGIEPTEEMFKQWLRDKEAHRRKGEVPKT